MRFTRALWLLALLACAALIAVGCGDDDDDNGGSGGDSVGIQAGSGDRADRARQLAEQAAGEPVELPKKKAGILNIVGAVESAQRAEAQIKKATQALGWTSTVCDAQGDPARMARCGDSLLSRNVDVMFVIGIEPSIIKEQLRKAKQKNVPVIQFSGQVTDDELWAGSFYPDEEAAGRTMGEWIVKKMQDVPENERTIVVHDFPAPWASARTKAMLEVIKQANVKVVDTVQSDAANLVDGTRKVVSDQLTKHPDVKGIYLAFDSAAPGAAQAVGQKFAGKAFPERPFVATFHGDLATLDLMRRGAIDMVVDVAYDATAFVAADQAAQFFARGTEISKEPRPDYPITFLDQVVLEADGELPAEGQYRETEDDFVTFFTEKWKKEFTNLGGGGGQSTDE